jgi:hypothetical protein
MFQVCSVSRKEFHRARRLQSASECTRKELAQGTRFASAALAKRLAAGSRVVGGRFRPRCVDLPLTTSDHLALFPQPVRCCEANAAYILVITWVTNRETSVTYVIERCIETWVLQYSRITKIRQPVGTGHLELGIGKCGTLLVFISSSHRLQHVIHNAPLAYRMGNCTFICTCFVLNTFLVRWISNWTNKLKLYLISFIKVKATGW